VAFEEVERETIVDFEAQVNAARPEWADSDLAFLVNTAPATKGRFARNLLQALAEAADAEVFAVRERAGNRRQIGNVVVEMKFSMEDPPRFQQVRPPEGEYDHLIGVCVRPHAITYWLIPGADVARLIDEDEISFQHAEDSRWFFPSLTADDAFSSFRSRASEFVQRLREIV
jgi:hypothetical protein